MTGIDTNIAEYAFDMTGFLKDITRLGIKNTLVVAMNLTSIERLQMGITWVKLLISNYKFHINFFLKR